MPHNSAHKTLKKLACFVSGPSTTAQFGNTTYSVQTPWSTGRLVNSNHVLHARPLAAGLSTSGHASLAEKVGSSRRLIPVAREAVRPELRKSPKTGWNECEAYLIDSDWSCCGCVLCFLCTEYVMYIQRVSDYFLPLSATFRPGTWTLMIVDCGQIDHCCLSGA